MHRLWAPWRLDYVQSEMQGCIFCEKLKTKNDKKAYILKRSKHSYALLNIYPYNNGHIMAAPFRHVDTITKLKNHELSDLMKLVCEMESLLRDVFKAHGFNIGINVNRTAGAGYAEHIHVHIVPRWDGDTNFMPVISDTKVLPASLDNVYAKLKKGINRNAHKRTNAGA